MRLRIESGNRITIPDDVIRRLRLIPGDRIEVRFPQMLARARGAEIFRQRKGAL